MKYFIDIDGVICTNTYGKYDQAKPIYENIKKINKKYDEGNEIILWTARGGTTGIDWRETTERQMNEWGVKYHQLRLDKPEYDVVVDDKTENIKEWK